MTRAAPFPSLPSLVIVLMLAGCHRQNSLQLDFQIGDRITVGPLVYNVVETVWRSQLGEALKTRAPQQRFLLISISVTNGGGQEVSVPMLILEGQNGQSYRESEDGEGIDNWIGLLRNVKPAQTLLGHIVFDVPLSSYKLRLTDGGEGGAEKYAWVNVPLRMDVDTGVASPTPGPGR
jgi:hypothetical protein